jgi:hypothetical protein
MSSSNTLDFGLEDLMVGIHRPRTVDAQSKLINNLRSVEGFIPIITDRCTDETVFGIEAFTELANAERFGLYAAHGIETLQYEVKILSTLKKKHGIESLNPYSFSREAAEGAGKKPSLFKRIWAAIVAAFTRLIIAVGNFIRNAINHIQSQFMKAQTKFYNANKDKIASALKTNGSKVKIKAILPSTDVLSIVSKAPAALNGMQACIGKTVKHTNSITSYVEKAAAQKAGFFTNLIASAKNSLAGTESEIKAVVKAASFGVAGSMTYKISEPAKIAHAIFYGKGDAGKAKEVTISELTKVVPFALLGDGAVKTMNDYVKNARAAVAELNKALTALRKASASADKLATKISKAKGSQSVHSILSTQAKAGSNTQRVAGFTTGIILNTFKEFLRMQSYAATGLRALLKGKVKKEKAPKKK